MQSLGLFSREIAEPCPAVAHALTVFAKIFAKVSAWLALRKLDEAKTRIRIHHTRQRLQR